MAPHKRKRNAPRGRLYIKAPKLYRGNACEVLNYRKRDQPWELGWVDGVPFFSWDPAPRPTPSRPSGWWTYRVRLERRSDRGRPLHLTVGDGMIRSRS